MSQGFKLKYDAMRDNNPGNAEDPTGDLSVVNSELYNSESNTRNICFTLLGGKRIFLNYSYLISGEYSPEENTITLTFTTHTVLLKGVQLEALFNELMQHLPKHITTVDARYNSVSEKGKSLVNGIEIIKIAE